MGSVPGSADPCMRAQALHSCAFHALYVLFRAWVADRAEHTQPQSPAKACGSASAMPCGMQFPPVEVPRKRFPLLPGGRPLLLFRKLCCRGPGAVGHGRGPQGFACWRRRQPAAAGLLLLLRLHTNWRTLRNSAADAAGTACIRPPLLLRGLQLLDVSEHPLQVLQLVRWQRCSQLRNCLRCKNLLQVHQLLLVAGCHGGPARAGLLALRPTRWRGC